MMLPRSSVLFGRQGRFPIQFLEELWLGAFPGSGGHGHRSPPVFYATGAFSPSRFHPNKEMGRSLLGFEPEWFRLEKSRKIRYKETYKPANHHFHTAGRTYKGAAPNPLRVEGCFRYGFGSMGWNIGI
jgi:hypothetical protein